MFENVQVPSDNNIGELDYDFVHLMTYSQQERLECAISSLVRAARILDETVAQSKNHKAFGHSIGQFQHNGLPRADLVTRIEVARAFIDQYAIAHVDAELTPIDAANANGDDVIAHCVQVQFGRAT